MNNSAKAQDYARILFEVVQEEGIIDEILYEMNSLQQMKVKDVARLLSVPVISKDIKMDLISSLKEFEISDIIINFFKLLIERNDFNLFLEIVNEYKFLYQEKAGIQMVTVHSARPLSSESINILVEELEKNLSSFVVITSIIDESLIGGVKIEYSGKEVDNTIKKHLNDFSNYLVRS